ncbi:hypothetical protein TWF679_005065 [Orbilia oligospora]|uniref:Uncharacterized protein n=1 Tax=Orbilia oligospora TaxID=2813651 RepID=A0A8H8UPL5_ORBOL|nr:hypothetical protein TWF679_005065 [Orbilia oligospora]
MEKKEKKKDILSPTMKLTTSSPPTALSFKIPDPYSNTQEQLRPPLTPATEVDLQKSCAILVQSTGYSRSFKDAINSSASKNATMTTTQRRGGGTIPVVSRSHNRASSKSGSRTPVGRVVKAGSSSSSAAHRRNGSTVRYEKTSTSKYVPPRRPAPEKALPVARRVKVKRDDMGGSEGEGSSSTVVKEKGQFENREKKSMDTIKEAKSSDGSSVEETRTVAAAAAATIEKNKKVGVKKLVNVMTGYIRPHEASSQPAVESQSSPSMSNEVSPLKEKSNPWESLQVKSSKKKDGTAYIEAIPEHLQTKTSSDEEGKHTGLKRSVSKRLGNAVKEYVKPPHVDRFTPEPLHPISPTSKEESKKTEQQKKYRVTKAMREYVRPSPTDISNVTIKEEEQHSSSQTSKPERTSKYIPAKPPSPVEKPTSPILTTTKDKDLQKASTEPTSSKQTTANNHSHHNPFRLLHDYVKPSMTESPALQTNIPQVPTHLSPILPSERKPLTTQRSQPSMPYVPPKIRPRGKTLPLDDNSLSPKPTSANNPSTVAAAAAAATRQGPIFGGGYPAKQDIIATTTTTTTTTTSTAGSKDKENRGPISPGFFGRNPGGSGFRIHFSHFLNKQRSDGYDQLE